MTYSCGPAFFLASFMRLSAFLLPCLILAGTACQRPTDRGNTTPPVTNMTPDATLRDTRWVLRQVSSQPLSETFPEGQEPFLFISAAGTAEGSGGCNRFRGGIKPVENDGELEFAPLQSTRMACPSLTTEQRLGEALAATRAYRIAGNTLLLYGNSERTGEPLAQFEAVHLR